MTPYYEQDGITIYHGDCRGVLPTLRPQGADLLLTDPPYGRSTDTDYSRMTRSTKVYPPVVGDEELFNPSHLVAYPRVILWGANHYASQLPDSGGWLVWDKRAGRQASNNFSDAELAWCSFKTPVRVFRHLWGVNRASEQRDHLHPTQKPVALMRWILEGWTEPGDLVLDPYMGSGPIAEAARQTDRRYIGIEIEERYCEVAVKRLAQCALDLSA